MSVSTCQAVKVKSSLGEMASIYIQETLLPTPVK